MGLGNEMDMTTIWHTESINDKYNFVSYSNPEFDRLNDAAMFEMDEQKAMEMWWRAQEVIAEDQPYTFLYAAKGTRILDKKIVIVERQPDGNEQYKKIYPLKSGSIQFYFNKWRKLEHTPAF